MGKNQKCNALLGWRQFEKQDAIRIQPLSFMIAGTFCCLRGIYLLKAMLAR
jgi:hypothetical protein